MPSKRRPTTSRGKRPVNAVRRTRAQAPAAPGPPHHLTTRAAVLGLVVCALVVSAALPLREYLAQRGQIESAKQELAAKELRVAQLEQRKRLLEDPAYVQRLARERLHFVKPGETAYVVLAPSAAPVPAGHPVPGVVATGPEAPWYSQVWGSVRAADRPAPLPTPTS